MILRTERTGDMKRWMPPWSNQNSASARSDRDLLGLWGDTSDNIPGAPGVGEKGAKQIIQQYGTIDNAIAHAGEISRKTYRESLQNNEELIRQSRELVTIACDMPITLELDKLIYEQPDRRAAYELFSELEFAQLSREFADAAEPASRERVPRRIRRRLRYSRITTRGRAGRFAESVWVRRDGGGRGRAGGWLYGVAISTAAGQAALIDFELFEVKERSAQIVVKESLENALLQNMRARLERRCVTAFDRYVCEGRNRAAFRHSAANTEGCIQDFKPAVRIQGVDEDTCSPRNLLTRTE